MNKRISTIDNRFVDEKGNHLILHGMNMVCKDKTRNYNCSWNFEDFEKLSDWGFNVIRLGIIWDGIEPELGKYDSSYLKKLDQLIENAKENNIYVFLDMHQDLFSVIFSDGAPEWATLTNGTEHVDGEIWSDAYFMSPAVQKSFDSFWNNEKAKDGKGIQTHYIEMWKMIADRYKQEPYVIGYDLMNEPFMGSTSNLFMHSILNQLKNNINDSDNSVNLTEAEMSEMWLESDTRLKLLKEYSDSNSYADLIDVTEDLLKKFDKEILLPFYNDITKAIREVDTESLIFFETNYLGNLGIFTGLDPIIDENKNRVNNQVYAPHGYDILTDTKHMKDANLKRIKLIFDRHFKTSLRLRIPMMIGEWGAYQSNDGLEEQSLYTASLFEKYLCSDTYWCFDKKIDFEKQSFFEGIHRSYPMSIAGTIQNYHNTQTLFHCVWIEQDSRGQESLFYIKDLKSIDTQNIVLEPISDVLFIKNQNNDSGYIKIQSIGENSFRTLDIKKIT